MDTHKNTHTAAVITLLGVLLATATFPATAAGYQDLVAWARGFGTLRRAGVEGTGSYGATLARYLRCEGVEVIEVNQSDKATRRRRARPTPSTPSRPPARRSPAEPPLRRKPETDPWR